MRAAHRSGWRHHAPPADNASPSVSIDSWVEGPQFVIERRSARVGGLGRRRHYSGNVVIFEQPALLELAIVASWS
jgi:hypothetical protein